MFDHPTRFIFPKCPGTSSFTKIAWTSSELSLCKKDFCAGTMASPHLPCSPSLPKPPGSGCRWEKWEEVAPGFDHGWFPFHHLQGDEVDEVGCWLAPSNPVFPKSPNMSKNGGRPRKDTWNNNLVLTFNQLFIFPK